MSSPLTKSFISRRRFFVIAALVVVAIAVAVFVSRPEPLPVVLKKIDVGNVEASVSNTRAGTIRACHRAKMSPNGGGQIAKLSVKKGQRVKRGQVLLELWNEDLHAQERLARDQLKTSTSRMQEVCSLAEAAERDADRSKELKAKGFISTQQLDRSLTDAQSRKAACETARNDIAQSHSRIALARAGLNRMVLRAPFDGIVADISGELGEYATPSPPGILTLPAIDLIDDSCLYVSAPIDEVDAAKVKVGLDSRITLDAMKGETFAGKVKRIAPYVLDLEKQARTVEVEVEIIDPPKGEALLVGYSADVEIIYDQRKNVVRVPTQTLLEGNRVLFYGNDGVLEERKLSIGLANWEYSEVTSGLAQGDQIVSSLDHAGVKAGIRVTPEKTMPTK